EGASAPRRDARCILPGRSLSWRARKVGNALPIGRPAECVYSLGLARQLPRFAAFHAENEDLPFARTRRDERELPAIGRPARPSVLTGRGDERARRRVPVDQPQIALVLVRRQIRARQHINHATSVGRDLRIADETPGGERLRSQWSGESFGAES